MQLISGHFQGHAVLHFQQQVNIARQIIHAEIAQRGGLGDDQLDKAVGVEGRAFNRKDVRTELCKLIGGQGQYGCIDTTDSVIGHRSVLDIESIIIQNDAADAAQILQGTQVSHGLDDQGDILTGNIRPFVERQAALTREFIVFFVRVISVTA